MSLFKKRDEPAAAPPAAVEIPAAPAAEAAYSAPAPDPEKLREAMAESQKRHLGLGQIVAVLAATPNFQGASLASVMALAAPAVATGQFVVAMGQTPLGQIAPAGIAIWASVSDEVDQRLSQELDKPFSISTNEWTNGPHLWVIMTAGDQNGVNFALANIQKAALQGRPMKMRVTEDGKTVVKTFVAQT